MDVVSDVKIIFIGGTGRCGKSVVAECLARHPDAIKLPFELRFLTDPDGIIDFYISSLASWSPFLVDRRITRLWWFLRELSMSPSNKYPANDDRRYAGWQLQKHLPNWSNRVEALMESLYDFHYIGKWVGMRQKEVIYHVKPYIKKDLAHIFGTFIQTIIADFLAEHDKSIFLSDDTWSALFVHELSELLPEAQFVHVYRDPRDVISSMNKQAWCPSNLELTTQYFLDIWKHIQMTFGGLDSARHLEMRFEDFISYPRPAFEQLCHFLDISFSKAMLEPKAHVGRWKDETNQEAFEAVMPLVKELGYE
jgi:hypothetical protein